MYSKQLTWKQYNMFPQLFKVDNKILEYCMTPRRLPDVAKYMEKTEKLIQQHLQNLQLQQFMIATPLKDIHKGKHRDPNEWRTIMKFSHYQDNGWTSILVAIENGEDFSEYYSHNSLRKIKQYFIQHGIVDGDWNILSQPTIYYDDYLLAYAAKWTRLNHTNYHNIKWEINVPRRSFS